MDTEAYLATIKAKLVNSAVVRQIDIVQEYFTREQGFFRARLTLQNDDFLEIAEFFHVVQGEAQTVEYRYQWMDHDRQVLYKRWDNAAHFPGQPNFPHHVHIGLTGAVESGRSLSTIELVDLIEQEIGHFG
jgi:hypothetical protein